MTGSYETNQNFIISPAVATLPYRTIQRRSTMIHQLPQLPLTKTRGDLRQFLGFSGITSFNLQPNV